MAHPLHLRLSRRLRAARRSARRRGPPRNTTLPTLPDRRFTAAHRPLAATALLALLAFVASPRPLAAQHPLVTLPLDDPAYVQLAALDRTGCAEARVSPFRPYLAHDVRRNLRRARENPRCAGTILTALLDRFEQAAPPAPAPGIDTASVDTLAGIAPDLARAIREDNSALDRDGEGRFRVGGKATLRVTSLSKGEFEPRWENVRPTSEGTAPVVADLRVRASWEASPRLVAVVEAFGVSHKRNDPQLRARSLRTTSGSVGFSEAYLAGSVGKFVLNFGRAHEAWLGRDRESMVLSAHAPPLDRLVASIATRRFEARAIAASLDEAVLDTIHGDVPSGTPPQRYFRMLVGHALVWRPIPAIEITGGETALLSRGSRTLDGAYLNPLMLYIVTQNDSGRENNRDNLTTFGSVRLRLGGASFTGELLVDDIQIDAADRKVTPDQLGWRFAATTPLPLALPASVTAEYRRIDSYTYMRGHYDEVYQQFDRPLGSELGPDADELRAEGELWARGTLRFAAGVGRWRRGILRIAQRPGIRAGGNAGQPFPNPGEGGYVQSAVLGDFVAQLLSVRLPLTARVQLARIENVNNTLSGPALYVRAQLIGSYAFRYP